MGLPEATFRLWSALPAARGACVCMVGGAAQPTLLPDPTPRRRWAQRGPGSLGAGVSHSVLTIHTILKHCKKVGVAHLKKIFFLNQK